VHAFDDESAPEKADEFHLAVVVVDNHLVELLVEAIERVPKVVETLIRGIEHEDVYLLEVPVFRAYLASSEIEQIDILNFIDLLLRDGIALGDDLQRFHWNSDRYDQQ